MLHTCKHVNTRCNLQPAELKCYVAFYNVACFGLTIANLAGWIPRGMRPMEFGCRPIACSDSITMAVGVCRMPKARVKVVPKGIISALTVYTVEVLARLALALYSKVSRHKGTLHLLLGWSVPVIDPHPRMYAQPSMLSKEIIACMRQPTCQYAAPTTCGTLAKP